MGSRLYFISAPPSSIISPSEPEPDWGRVGGNINLPSPAMLLCPGPSSLSSSEHYNNTVTTDHCSGEDDPGGGGDGVTRSPASLPVRETIFSSEIRSVEYAERPGDPDTDTREPGDTECQGPGTILFDDIGNAPPSMLTQSSDAFFLGIDFKIFILLPPLIFVCCSILISFLLSAQ